MTSHLILVYHYYSPLLLTNKDRFVSCYLHVSDQDVWKYFIAADFVISRIRRLNHFLNRVPIAKQADNILNSQFIFPRRHLGPDMSRVCTYT